MDNALHIGGTFLFECYDKDGNLKWRDTAKNAVTNAGLNSVLNVYLGATAKISTWYCGLIDSVNFSALAAADTAVSHTGWEEADEYTQSARPTWGSGTSSAQSIANATAMDFTINATKTIKGAFLISDDAKNGTAGVLFCTALFSQGDRAVASADVLKVTYTISAASA